MLCGRLLRMLARMSDDRDPGDVAAEPAQEHGLARGDRVHAFKAPGITVTWSSMRCTHVAECVFNLPTVFEPGRRPWVDAARATADRVAHVVTRCPTGALHFERTDGGDAEAPAPANTVLVSKNGPLLLRGDIEVLDDSGNVMLRDTRVALCRCGLSKHKPLCDNSHTAADFSEEGLLREPERVEDPGAPGTGLRVAPHARGPLEITGPFAIASADRKTLLAGTKTKLCRCGHSGAKPFCDGTHKRLQTALE